MAAQNEYREKTKDEILLGRLSDGGEETLTAGQDGFSVAVSE